MLHFKRPNLPPYPSSHHYFTPNIRLTNPIPILSPALNGHDVIHVYVRRRKKSLSDTQYSVADHVEKVRASKSAIADHDEAENRVVEIVGEHEWGRGSEMV